jgi:iron complex transport system substrate-binding protein
MTEIIFAAGGGEKLVGVTTYCDFPKEVAPIEKIGDTQTPNIERIIALDPDVVFVSTASQLEAFMSAIEQRSIAVFVVNVRSFDDLYRSVKVVGEILGTEEVTLANVVNLSGRESFIRHRRLRDPEIGKAPRVFVQISNEPLFTIGKDSFLTEVVENAGGESVTKDVPSGYPKLSKETASAMDPDVIILSDSEDNREPNAVFKNSNAVKNGRVYRINADIISRPGPRLVDALEQIAGFLNK